MFLTEDLTRFHERGLDPGDAAQQIALLRLGTQYVTLAGPAMLGNGILNPGDCLDAYVAAYDNNASEKKIVRFVPASGAASRMFKSLIGFVNSGKSGENAYNECIHQNDFYSPGYTLKHINAFAFAPALASMMKTRMPLRPDAENFIEILRLIISEEGLNYAALPKGLLLFHRYDTEVRTAFAEHIAEGLQYAVTREGLRLHFTVSPEHIDAFKKLSEQVLKLYDREGVNIGIDFSVQMPKTDTLALDAKGMPFRNPDGSLLFRPGGHGALIENLNTLDADFAFIKNIDNVVPDRLKPETTLYKKVLGGVLIGITQKIFSFLQRVQQHQCTDAEIQEIRNYAANFLHVSVPPAGLPREKIIEKLVEILNRPVRVCGMVKNTGEPGGGPFWVRNADGKLSLQIVEKAQIDLSKPDQKAMFEAATHFNPVDLVCSLRDYTGNAFDLLKYRDPNTCFVASKTHQGEALSALELPGLWNGAMADWITVFVEVPLITFNPVKEVNDLLRDEHQNPLPR